MNYGIYWSDIPWTIRSKLVDGTNDIREIRLEEIDEQLSQFGAELSKDYVKTRVVFPDEASYLMFLLRYA